MQLQSKIQFIKNIFNEHLNQIRYTFIIMMTERLSNTELKRVKQICKFIIAIYYSFKARCRQKLQSNYRRFLTEIVVLEHQKRHFRASRFKIFLGERAGGRGSGMPAGPLMIRGLRRSRQYLRKFYPNLKPSGGWTV